MQSSNTVSIIKKIGLCSVLLLLTACVTPYKDPRPIAEQQAALASVSKQLIGTYEILERRGDGWGNEDEGGVVTLQKNNGIFAISIANQKRQTHSLVQSRSENCLASESAERGMMDLFCSPKDATEVSFISISRNPTRSVIKSGAMISAWKPMAVSADEYVLQIGVKGSGHSYYYRLKKKE